MTSLGFSSDLQWRISSSPVPYEQAEHFMEKRVEEIYINNRPNCIWLLEHPPLYTYGTSSKIQEEVVNPLHSLPFPLYKSGRGGRLTYHGPGQRIIYCMINLKKISQAPDLKEFMHLLETWIIKSLQEFNIETFCQTGLTGVWARTNTGKVVKIAALGVRIRHWISFHGISLNISPDLSHYHPIFPCGLKTYDMSSLEALGYQVAHTALDEALKKTCPF